MTTITHPTPKLTLIAAIAANGIIGRTENGVGTLPWRLPEDLKRFKALTLGHPIVMGRKTWESLGRPLPGRRNIVISRNADYVATGAEVFTSLAAARDACRDIAQVFVIGGAELYSQALAEADCLELTELHSAAEGDTYFPAFSRDEWQQIFRDCQRSQTGIEYDFVTYTRKET